MRSLSQSASQLTIVPSSVEPDPSTVIAEPSSPAAGRRTATGSAFTATLEAGTYSISIRPSAPPASFESAPAGRVEF